MDMTKILEMIDSQTKATEGEVLILTRGEYDSFSVMAVVRVCRDINLRLEADEFLAKSGARLQSPAVQFDAHQFLAHLEAVDAVEIIQTRSVHVMDDFECTIATPVTGRNPANDPDALPYEWAESEFDLKARG